MRFRASRRTVTLTLVAAASAFAVTLVVVRFAVADDLHYGNLIWNLVLAWVPVGLALIAYDRSRRGGRGVALAAPLVLWFVFLPNAPYLVTELMFLDDVSDMPRWFDALLLTTYAWLGLLLGFISVYLVQDIARRSLGPVAGWLCAVGSFAACGIGIYLGRVLRWNSWDLLLQPAGVLRDVGDTFDSPRLVALSLLIALSLTAGYATLYGALQAAVDERR